MLLAFLIRLLNADMITNLADPCKQASALFI
jgi:hypothetical protein